MPPSQLKRLKTSLREKGITGPQKSKKQKQQARKNGQNVESRIQRNASLQSLREQFNPFEVQAPARRSKYDFVNSRGSNGQAGKGQLGRPGVTKSLGEETRRKTLLKEMERRQKVGGIVDRRFGENDPTMTPEERAMERFVKEKQKASKKSTLFDLEDDEDAEEELTHFGRSLAFTDGDRSDDFDEAGLGESEDEISTEGERRSRKRRRLSEDDESQGSLSEQEDQGVPERPKTKQEVMKEVMAKSKLYKHERQKAKEDDDELREELDKALPDIYALLNSTKPRPPPLQVLANKPPEPTMNPDRAALLSGKDRAEADKEYDERLRQMALDARAKPTNRTRTEEERAQEEAERLRQLERKRLARMRGEESDEGDRERGSDVEDDEKQQDEDDVMRLGKGLQPQTLRLELDVEDEDEFDLDENLIASDPDVSDLSEEEESTSESGTDPEEEEFTAGLVTEADAGRQDLIDPIPVTNGSNTNVPKSTLAYTYPCPQTHDEFLEILKAVSVTDTPLVVQRIRALYHPNLSSNNKIKLATFSCILIDHIYHLANQPDHPPFSILDSLTRHAHSMARSYPMEIAVTFRKHLASLQTDRPTSPTAGDLVLFTGIGEVFPTSDHSHPVVTPANLLMGRYLSQKIPQTLGDLATGTYLATLMLQYQRLSKRYIPEVVNYIMNALYALSPTKIDKHYGYFPLHKLPAALRIDPAAKHEASKLDFWSIQYVEGRDLVEDENLKHSLMETYCHLIKSMADLWTSLPSFPDIFTPFREVLSTFLTATHTFSQNILLLQTKKTLDIMIATSLRNRTPLREHNHRPIAIKTSIPKFEPAYNPDRHYDPDRDRAEGAKLRKEIKRERKGALRELRKDAAFMGREQLKEKRERDRAHGEKMRKIEERIKRGE